MLILKIYRPDLHFSSLNGVNVAPSYSSIVRSVAIDTIQVARFTVTVPPGSLYRLKRGTINYRYVVILIFCREFMAIVKS